MAERIQLRRTKGWRLPDGAVSVARPTKWGNDFPVGQDATLDIGGHARRFRVHDAAQAVLLYETWQVRTLPVHELRGKDLACWCPLDQPCHADVLLELANKETP